MPLTCEKLEAHKMQGVLKQVGACNRGLRSELHTACPNGMRAAGLQWKLGKQMAHVAYKVCAGWLRPSQCMPEG